MSKKRAYDELKEALSMINNAVAELGVAIADDMEPADVIVSWLDEAIEHIEAAQEELEQ